MLKKIIVIVLLLPTLLLAKSPTEEDLLDKITDPKGDFYYPNLMMRFEMGDITLTAEQYHYLYYGYIYQEEYQPQVENPHMERLMGMMATLDIEDPSVGSLGDIVLVAGDLLKQDPFSPKVWNILAYAYGTLGDKIKEREAYDRLEKILQTIDESGDGLREKSPKHILMFEHAHELMASKDLNSSKGITVSREVEFVPLVTPIMVEGRRVKGYYFDYSRIYLNKPESITYTRDRTWQFNNLKPKAYK